MLFLFMNVCVISSTVSLRVYMKWCWLLQFTTKAAHAFIFIYLFLCEIESVPVWCTFMVARISILITIIHNYQLLPWAILICSIVWYIGSQTSTICLHLELGFGFCFSSKYNEIIQWINKSLLWNHWKYSRNNSFFYGFTVCYWENGRRWRHKIRFRLHGYGKSKQNNWISKYCHLILIFIEIIFYIYLNSILFFDF